MAEKEQDPSFRGMITDANQPAEIHKSRLEMVKLFEEDDWRLTRRAEEDGRQILNEKGYKQATQWGICEYILDLLQNDFPIRAVGMGEPPGCRGVAYELHNADGLGLYIKLKVEENRIWVLSFHY